MLPTRMFRLTATTAIGRRGELTTPHGTVTTPLFFPVATAGAMKGMTHEDLLELGAEALLCNTYHLHLQPGEDIVRDAGGLHTFIGWDKPILTDSGGFQVFSLRKMSKITEAGVKFRSHRDGSLHFLGPDEAMQIQHKLGSDIIMVFDECPPSTAKRRVIQAAVDRTLRWAKRCKQVHEDLCQERGLTADKRPLLFCIVQGGLERDLREKCAQELIAIGFDGYAIGGLAVGESNDEMLGVIDVVCPLLPQESVRYLMGVGRSEQHRECVRRGIDLFDCVLPMREARHGTLHLSDGTAIRITNARYLHDHSPIDPQSPVAWSRTHKRSYLCHLLRSKERLGESIACAQNMGLTLQAIRTLREEIEREANHAA